MKMGGVVLVLLLFFSFSLGQREGLEDLYVSTNGTFWLINTNWMDESVSFCDWYGVVCDLSENVISLALEDNFLDGVLPSSLFENVTTLTVLELERNEIAGTLPSEIGLVLNLRTLNLKFNRIAGAVPSEIGLLPLETIDLSHNQFSEIPTEMGEISSLSVLEMDYNYFASTLPSELGALSNLQTLSLFGNSFYGHIPSEFGLLGSLQSLNLQRNSLNGTIPTDVATMSSLEFWLVSWNPLEGTIPSEMGSMSALQAIYMTNTDLTGEIPIELANLVNLETLFLSGDFSGQIPTELALISSLRELDLSDSGLSGTIPTEFGNFPVLRALKIQNIDLSTGTIPTELAQISTLERIDFFASNLTGTIPPELGSIPALESLIVFENSLSGTLPTELANAPRLRTLILGNNADLTGTLPTEYGTLSDLENLQVSLSAITGTVPTEYGDLSELKFFSAGHTDLSGTLPEWICDVGTDFQELQFLCPLPMCCDTPGKNCGLQCLGLCEIELNQLSPAVASLPQVFTADTSCGAGRYVWSYTQLFRDTEPIFLCNGTNPQGVCSGNTLETLPNAFNANATIDLRVQFLLEGIEESSPLNPTVSIRIPYPSSPTSGFLFYGSTGDEVVLEASFVNNNYFENVNYVFSCEPQDPSECPYCPSDDDAEDVVFYTSTDPNFIIDFDQEFDDDCTYDIGVAMTFLPSEHVITAQREVLVLEGDREVPFIKFDSDASSCVAETNDGAPYVALGGVEGLPSGYSVLDYIWVQTQGNTLTCDDDAENCGGDGNPFLYFDADDVVSCRTYAWDVTIVIGSDDDDDDDIINVLLPTCEMSFLSPPEGGTCFVDVSDSDIDDDDCNASPLSFVAITCEDWTADCVGQSPQLTYQVFRFSESGTDSLVPLDAPSVDLTSEFLVPDEDMDVLVRVCNAEVCVLTDKIEIEVCKESKKERRNNIEELLEQIQEDIINDDLEEALQKLLAVGNSLKDCEEYFDELIRLTNEYVAATIAAAQGNATRIIDTTVLMELLGTIGSRSCASSSQLRLLFEALLALCEAPTTADVQTFALDELLETILDNTKDDQDKIDAIDFALKVNECVAARTLSDRCNDRLPTFFEGDSFFFGQYIFTMEQFRRGEVSIDIPNATVFFPPGFDRQIARDYTLETRDPVARFTCVAINMARTDGILSTGVSIDSAVIGMTAMVFVNGTAITIELGHQGQPVLDVILRIYRQTQREDGQRKKEHGHGHSLGGHQGGKPKLSFSPSQRKKDREDMKKKHADYEARLTLADECEEEITCSYYEGEGLLSTAGCQTVDVTDEYVDCACNHYSNFGLLFSTCDSEEWTVWRILSVSLLGFFWITLCTLGMLVSCSSNFRRWSGFETRVERNHRVLGERGGTTRSVSVENQV